MPIEIRELIIKATVASAGGGAGGGESQAIGSDNNNVPPGEEFINTCIEKILEILREKNER